MYGWQGVLTCGGVCGCSGESPPCRLNASLHRRTASCNWCVSQRVLCPGCQPQQRDGGHTARCRRPPQPTAGWTLRFVAVESRTVESELGGGGGAAGANATRAASLCARSSRRRELGELRPVAVSHHPADARHGAMGGAQRGEWGGGRWRSARQPELPAEPRERRGGREGVGGDDALVARCCVAVLGAVHIALFLCEEAHGMMKRSHLWGLADSPCALAGGGQLRHHATLPIEARGARARA
jgi:hypothetical protein